MFKRAALTMSELALWLGFLMLLMASGCEMTKSETAKKESHPATSQASPNADEQATVQQEPYPPAEATTTKSLSPTLQALTDVPLIPREVLFGNPTRAQARLSPDGKWLSYLAPVEGVLNVWVGPADDPEAAQPVTKDKKRGIHGHSWSFDSKYIIYSQDDDGDENWHIYATDVATKKTRDLTPIDEVNARLAGASQDFPTEVLIGLNDRVPQLHDIYRVNIETGEKKLLQENPGVAGFVADDKLAIRMALNFTPSGGQVWLQPEGKASEKGFADWQPFEQFGPEDAMTSGPTGFDKTGETLYFEDSRDRNTAGLFTRHLKTGETKLLAADKLADVGGVLVHPTEKNIQAVSFTYDRRKWKVLDDAIAADLEFLKVFQDGEFEITSRTLDDKFWTVAYILDDGPVKFYRYERGPEPKMHYLFASRDDLEKYPLAKMHAPIIQSRDGLNLVSYLTLPPGSDPDGDGKPEMPVPMVLDVHGGPWARDGWGFNPTHQWLANRGYAVLNVNYRGSTGFGKDFINAANGEWSGKMHDDLIDAVNWAVEQGVAERDKIAIMGGSYGGYATLVGLTFTPDVFAAGVDIVGPSSLVTLMENVPPYWMPFMPVMKTRVGDWETEEGKAELLKRSPLPLVDKIEKPLLIGQGANDPRVTQLEADQIVKAMEEKDIPVTYVLYPDEGHGFARPENSMSFNAVAEAFLAEHLGGRFEPVGDDFEGASIEVPAGAAGVPGLTEALAKMAKDN